MVGALKRLLLGAFVVTVSWPQWIAWGMGEHLDCVDIEIPSPDNAELSELAKHCARGDIAKLNAALRIQPADVELSCQVAREDFREGQSVPATLRVFNKSNRRLRFLHLSEERLTGGSYVSQNEFRDDYVVRFTFPARSVAVVQPGAVLQIPIALKVEGVGAHRVSVALVAPEWKSVGSGGSEVSSKVISRTECTFKVAR